MNKINLMIITLTTMSLGAIAQETTSDSREQFKIGIKGGFNYANVYDSQGEEFKADPKLGLALGAFLIIPIGTTIGIQPEVMYSQKGFSATGKVLGLNYDFKRTTNYLDVPLFLALKPSEFFTILAGPQFSYLLSRKDVFATAITTIEQEQEFENDNIRKNTLGVSLGVDLNFNSLVLGARAAWDLQNNNGDGTATTPRYKNQWIQATVGFKF
ncbi:MAG: PorT family protein [Flavobacteriales bacterium CG_4_10_14_0_2_um_filter_32_8]|nr:MAG: PorT family protein [Flavobacteriales bacterium CG_4_10_14_0_2_um_filter_32_8]PJB13878.1 MAG: PorT family protein [Flavobacteriales bacterium CG_4_9_14_3_um_filter_32_8]